MATVSSTQPPIVWAHELDPETKMEAFKSFISKEINQLPEGSQARTEDKDVFVIPQDPDPDDYTCCYPCRRNERPDLFKDDKELLIPQDHDPQYQFYFDSQYCGPYRWDELPDLFKDDKELCVLFFKSFSNGGDGFGWYTKQYWQGMAVLLRYAPLDEYTLNSIRGTIRDNSTDNINKCFLPGLLQAPSSGVTQDLLDHAFENALILLLGSGADDAETKVPGLIMNIVPSIIILGRISVIAQIYSTLSSMDRHKMELMCNHFAERLKEMENLLLKPLLEMNWLSFRFIELKLDLIVNADVARLLQSRDNASSVKALSGDKDMLLERWIGKCFELVDNSKNHKSLIEVNMLFDLYYFLRKLPAVEKGLLLKRNKKLFNELEEYVLACMCNKHVSSSGEYYRNRANDEERKLIKANNRSLLNPGNGWLSELMVATRESRTFTDKVGQGSYGKNVDAIVGKYWNLTHASKDALFGSRGTSDVRDEASTTTNDDSSKSPPNPDDPDKSSIARTLCKLALVLILAVVMRYFICGRSWSNAGGIHHTSAARGLSKGAQISNHA